MTTSAWLLFITISLVTALEPGAGHFAGGLQRRRLGTAQDAVEFGGQCTGRVFGLSRSDGRPGHFAAHLGPAVRGFEDRRRGLPGLPRLAPVDQQDLDVRHALAGAIAAGQKQCRAVPPGPAGGADQPESILFFTALFPQFIHPEAPVLPQFLALTSAFAAHACWSRTWLYVLLARHTHRWFGTPRRARVFNRICGGAFGLLGLSLLRLKSPS